LGHNAKLAVASGIHVARATGVYIDTCDDLARGRHAACRRPGGAQRRADADEAKLTEIVTAVAAEKLPVVLRTLDPEGARLIARLRRPGHAGPFLGGDSFGDESFARLLAKEPEGQWQPGFFTDNLYGLTPVIFDSANAEMLAFAQRFRARFHHDPVWDTVAGYDAT
jgi:hypothetical protein